MPIRARLATCLVVAAALSAASSASRPANALDLAVAKASGVSSGMEDCVRYVTQQATVVRCAQAESRTLSDHGMTAAGPYDAQGNPVDRHGNVVAVPEGGRAQHREVFASEHRALSPRP